MKYTCFIKNEDKINVMDTTYIRFFARVYEQRSINKAAKQLFITPQGLSKIIQHLEEELGVNLFERSSNGMIPTESGTYFYENCRSILYKLDEIEIGIRQIRDRDKKLIIGFSCGVLNVFPFKKLDEYKKIYNNITIQWEEDSNQEIINKVLKGNIDIGFAIGQITNHDLWSKELFSKKMNAIIYEGHPFFKRDCLSINDLREEALITLNEKYYSYHSLIQRCQDFGFYPSIIIKTMESQIIYHFCKQKVGLGIDVNIHQNEFSMDTLHLIELYDSIPWTISIIIRNDRKKERTIYEMADLFI